MMYLEIGPNFSVPGPWINIVWSEWDAVGEDSSDGTTPRNDFRNVGFRKARTATTIRTTDSRFADPRMLYPRNAKAMPMSRVTLIAPKAEAMILRACRTSLSLNRDRSRERTARG